MQSAQRTTVRGPTFIRLLARLADVDALPSSESLPDRLSQWLSWTHALALSTALDGHPSTVESDGAGFGPAEEAECSRVRQALTEAIQGARELAASGQGGAERVEAAADFTAFRQRYLTLQRAMQASTGRLRGSLRDLLAQSSDAMARLAEVDAVMELALSPREQKLLATVPALLGRHFERMRDAAQATPAETSGAWLDAFRKDMQSVLLAELDVRFQPVEALLAALRTR